MLLAPMIMLFAAQGGAAQNPPADPAPVTQGPAAPASPGAGRGTAHQDDNCRNVVPTEPGEIVVCAQKQEGYRIDPDILAAKKAAREGRKPKRPERFVDTSCATVGPMGCRGNGAIDLVGAALAAVNMAQTAAKGGDVGKMFITDPQPTEYELYLELKQEREEREAAEAAKAPRQAAEAPAR